MPTFTPSANPLNDTNLLGKLSLGAAGSQLTFLCCVFYNPRGRLAKILGLVALLGELPNAVIDVLGLAALHFLSVTRDAILFATGFFCFLFICHGSSLRPFEGCARRPNFKLHHYRTAGWLAASATSLTPSAPWREHCARIDQRAVFTALRVPFAILLSSSLTHFRKSGSSRK